MGTGRLTLIYHSYGQGAHTAQIAYSALTAFRFRPRRRRADFPAIAVFTDRVDDFADLPVECIEVSPDELRAWRGPLDFIHLIKLEILRLGLERFRTPCVMVDADTYFRRDPTRLAARLGPGRSVMHIRETRLGTVGTPSQMQVADDVLGAEYTDAGGQPVVFERGMPLWNAGVVGVDPANAELVDRAIHLTPQIHARTRSMFAEQVATNYYLQRFTRLRGAADIVYHYWPYKREPVPPYGPSAWGRRISDLLEQTAGLPPEKRGAELVKHAYRPPLSGPDGRLQWMIRPALVAAGRREPVVRRSV